MSISVWGENQSEHASVVQVLAAACQQYHVTTIADLTRTGTRVNTTLDALAEENFCMVMGGVVDKI